MYNNVTVHEVLLKKAQFSLAKSDAYLLVKEKRENARIFCSLREKKNMRDGERGLQV